MIGWNISVYKQADGGSHPATWESGAGTRLAVWQTNEYGLDWLQALAAAGKAVDLGGNGYPNQFTATAEHIVPRILEKPPHAHDVWHLSAGDVVLDTWVGKTVVNSEAARNCRFDEWLLVTAWDES